MKRLCIILGSFIVLFLIINFNAVQMLRLSSNQSVWSRNLYASDQSGAATGINQEIKKKKDLKQRNSGSFKIEGSVSKSSKSLGQSGGSYDNKKNRYDCFKWKKQKQSGWSLDPYRRCFTIKNTPDGYKKGPEFTNKNGGEYYYGFEQKSIINLMSCLIWLGDQGKVRHCAKSDSQGGYWKLSQSYSQNGGPVYYGFNLTNLGACERECKQMGKCFKCSHNSRCFSYKYDSKYKRLPDSPTYTKYAGETHYMCTKK